MATGALPQWKRELLQRRAARARPQPPAPPPPPPPDEDEELRYGPGIVKRLKSRYLSLALRDAPRRRPSVLRRAASLEQLLDERPPPAPRGARPARAPRPSEPAPPAPSTPPSPAPAAAPPRRDHMKRARSVDALSRLEPRDEPPPSPPAVAGRLPRPPRRPAPLLRAAERPPPDVVRAALRKFEPGAARRGPAPRSPGPPADRPDPTAARAVSRAALDGIARAGSSTRYSFEAPRLGSHLPLGATNPVMLGRARRVGVIRPMPPPAPASPPPRPDPAVKPGRAEAGPRTATPPPPPTSPAPEPPRSPPPPVERRTPPPAALVEPIPRPAPEEPPPARAPSPSPAIRPPPASPKPAAEDPPKSGSPRPETGRPEPLVNGHSREQSRREAEARAPQSWAAGRRRAPPAATSVVFNFSDRKEVPDYIENDGIILRASRRDRVKVSARSAPGGSPAPPPLAPVPGAGLGSFRKNA